MLAILPIPALASVDYTGMVLDPNPAETGQAVSVSVEAQKSGSGCDNNWGYTKVFVDGVQVGTTTLGSFTGSGTTTDSFDLGAFNTKGDRTVDVELWSGAEDFTPPDGNPDCADTLLASDSAVLKVNDAPEPSKPSSGSVSGGGGFIYCDLWGSEPVGAVHQCLDRNTGRPVPTLVWRNGAAGGGDAAFQAAIQNLLQQVLRIKAILDAMR